MAPKKKQKTAHVAVAAVDALPEAICQEYLVKVHEAISCIQAHDMFSNIAASHRCHQRKEDAKHFGTVIWLLRP